VSGVSVSKASVSGASAVRSAVAILVSPGAGYGWCGPHQEGPSVSATADRQKSRSPRRDATRTGQLAASPAASPARTSSTAARISHLTRLALARPRDTPGVRAALASACRAARNCWIQWTSSPCTWRRQRASNAASGPASGAWRCGS
jgi:hypothetical protein